MTEDKPLTGWHPRSGERKSVQLPRLKPETRRKPHREKSKEEREFEALQARNRKRTTKEARQDPYVGKHRLRESKKK